MPQIDFLMVAGLHGLFFNPIRAEGLEFEAASPSLRLTIKPEDPAKDAFVLHQKLIARVFASRDVPSEVANFVNNLVNRKFDISLGTEISLPHVVRGDIKIDAEGHIAEGYTPPLDYYPTAVQELYDSVCRELKERLVRFLKLMRWQQEFDAPHQLFAVTPALYWKVPSKEEGPYWAAGFRKNVPRTTRALVGITWTDEDKAKFGQLWATPTADEPLGHELRREAQLALEGSPRSSLLLAATAIETGVKMHASKLAPDATWIISEMPSPPIHKMLRSYLPQLHAAHKCSIERWGNLKPLFNKMQKLAEYRNVLTHRGDMTN